MQIVSEVARRQRKTASLECVRFIGNLTVLMSLAEDEIGIINSTKKLEFHLISISH